jgi:peroxiredoxin
MKKSLILVILAAGLLFACTPKPILQPGPYLGIIRIDSADRTLDVPFNMNLSVTPDGQWMMEVTNAGETILLNELKASHDTLTMRFPIFQSEIICRFTKDSLIGLYYPKGKDAGTAYPFVAPLGVRDRFPQFTEPSSFDVTGRWRILENPGTPDSNMMVGEFTQENNRVTGTILANGGDYRYLEGKVSGNKFMVSAVDGAHSLIFTADVSPDGTLENGRFLGSPRWTSKWRAVKDETAALPAMDKVVWLKKDAAPFAFTFPDLTGKPVSLADPKFRGKVVIIEAMGSWCPNCMDESMFLKDVYEKYNDRGLEIIGLCFEDKTFEASQPKMQRFIDQTGAGYTFLYAGPRSGESLRNVLYVADGQLAFPSTLYIDRKGTIRRIETGFSGPGTGSHYEDLKAEITAFVEKLLAEGQAGN